ncbi:MAG: methylmalonyl-CoA epimerase [Candidatus Caldatribacteriota bacterium]
MINKIDHIGIAVKSIEKARHFYEDILGLKITGVEVVEEQKVKVAFIPLGDSELELLEPTSSDGPVARFIESKGEGIHHLAYRVYNLDKTLKKLKETGIRLIDEKPRYGAGNAQIAFLHPKSSGGVLIELSERGDQSR